MVLRYTTHLLTGDLVVPVDKQGVKMKVKYYKDTDSLYIDLSEKKSSSSQEVAPGIVIDFDDKDNIVGIDIDTASENMNLSRVELSNIPMKELVSS